LNDRSAVVLMHHFYILLSDQYNEYRGNNLFHDIEHTRYFCSV